MVATRGEAGAFCFLIYLLFQFGEQSVVAFCFFLFYCFNNKINFYLTRSIDGRRVYPWFWLGSTNSYHCNNTWPMGRWKRPPPPTSLNRKHGHHKSSQWFCRQCLENGLRLIPCSWAACVVLQLKVQRRNHCWLLLNQSGEQLLLSVHEFPCIV